MKKFISICLLCLIALSVTAQTTATRRLRVKTKPEGKFITKAYWSKRDEVTGRWVDHGQRSDTIDIDLQVPVGQRFYISVGTDTDVRDLPNYYKGSWTINGDTQPAKFTNGYLSFEYTMPDYDVDIEGYFEYDPTPPAAEQPGYGAWYPDEGLLIEDYYGYPQGFNSSDDGPKVKKYILARKDIDQYSGARVSLNSFSNLEVWDLSRSNATKAEATLYYNSNEPRPTTTLQEVLLPATIKELKRNAFQCSNLQTLVLYAMTPPTNGDLYYNRTTGEYEWVTAFPDCQNMTVRVPEAAIPLYKADEHWNIYNILAIESDYANITVNMLAKEDATQLAKYKGMYLDLTSQQSGITQTLLVDERNTYEFRYLPINATYDVVLRSHSGAEVGKIANVYIEKDSKTVTFESLRNTHTIQLCLAADGQPVDELLYSNVWLNSEKTFLKRGNTLNNTLDNETVKSVLTFERELAMKYELPDTIDIVVAPDGSSDKTVIALQPLSTTTIHVAVVDSLTKNGINKATVQVVQMLKSGESGVATVLTSDSYGNATGQVVKGMSTITVNTLQYGAISFIANLNDSTDFRKAFIAADGTVIKVGHTWQAAVHEGEQPTVEDGYSDERSMEYTLTNVTTGKKIEKYLFNYPLFALYEKLPQGTRVRISASSANNLVEPVDIEGVVNESGTVNVTLPVVERGHISVAYQRSESIRPAFLIFKEETGELVKKQPFGDYKTQDIKGLPAGNYYVVVMSQGAQFTSLSNKNQLELYTADKDYAAQSVTVSDGTIKDVEFEKVPLTMTQLNTNLTERRATFGNSTASVGFGAGIKVKVAFEGLYEKYLKKNKESDYPTNCKLEVYIPKGLSEPSAYRSYRQFTFSYRSDGVTYNDVGTYEEAMKHENVGFHNNSSLVSTKADSEWNPVTRKLTADWPSIEEGGTMSLAMTCLEAGAFIPEAYLTYTLNGKEYHEILETNTLSVSKSGIKVPELIITPTFKASGTAMYISEEAEEVAASRRASYAAAYRENIPYQAVTVMDGDQPIGKAVINSNGEWKADCVLPNPTKGSKHNIWAKIVHQNGVSYQTENRTLTYDPTGVIPLSTKMSFFNHHLAHLVNTEVVFDYVNNRAYPSSYGFSNQEGYNTDFTFEINLSNNNPEKVYAVAVYISTDGPDAEERVSMAHYNQRKDRWIAYEKFNTRSLPSTVMVEPYYYKDDTGSKEEFDEAFNMMDEMFKKNDEQAMSLLERFNKLIDQGAEASEKNDASLAPDPAELSKVMQELFGITTGKEYEASATESDGNIDKLLEKVENDPSPFKKVNEIFENVQKVNELKDMVEGITTSPAAGLTPASLKAEGYEEFKLDDGSNVYCRFYEDGSWAYVDFGRDVKIDIPANTKLARLMDMRKNRALLDDEWFYTMTEFIYQGAQDIVSVLGQMSDACSIAIDAIQLYIESCAAKQGEFIKMVEFNNKHLGWVERGFANLRLKFAYDSMTKTITAAQKLRDAISKFKIGDGVGTLASFYSLVTNYVGFKGQDEALYNMAKALPTDPKKCDDYEKALSLQSEINSFLYWIIPYQTATLSADFVAFSAGLYSLVSVPADPTKVTAWSLALSIGKIALSIAAQKIYDSRYSDAMEVFQWKRSEIECDKKKTCKERGDCPKCVNKGDCPEWPKRPKEPKYPKTDPTLDPSGFVYEGVESNRLEGATTTVFYKTTVKNIFGEDEDKVTMWDAENYDQVNPQVTDENGEYGWMVPTGLWQVKYEKEGYQTEYSDWLPVPPPQLDVNQGMKQLSRPVVNDVKATQTGVQVSFDKYMLASTLTNSNIVVMKDGNVMAGTVELIDAEGLSEESKLTQKVRFITTEKLTIGGKILLTVKGAVESYANVQMGDVFSQEFTVKEAVEQIQTPETANVIYGEGYEMTIQALPGAAAAGKKVNVKVLGEMVASVNATELTLNSEGKASLIITGEAQGTTAVVLQMADDPDVMATTVVQVRDALGFVCPMPESNYAPSQAYPEGIEIELSCELPEATILYTLDGSCPCSTGNDVRTYSSPILLTSNLVIKAVASAPGYVDSDIVELSFKIDDGTGMVVVEKRHVTNNNATYTLSGVNVGKRQNLPKGVYIRNGKKIVVK